MTALDLLDNPHELYRTGNETVCSILNRTFFPRLYIDGHKVTGYELNEPFDIFNEAYIIYRQHQAERQGERGGSEGGQSHGYTRGSTTGVVVWVAPRADLAATTGQPELPAGPDRPQTASSADLQTETGAASRATLIRSLALTLAGHGSSRRVMVGWVCAREHGGMLVGFVNVVWDGATHAFLLDIVVSCRTRRQGAGTSLVAYAVEGARRAGCEWMHVDFGDHLRRFYLDSCGFRPTAAGLIALKGPVR